MSRSSNKVELASEMASNMIKASDTLVASIDFLINDPNSVLRLTESQRLTGIQKLLSEYKIQREGSRQFAMAISAL